MKGLNRNVGYQKLSQVRHRQKPRVAGRPCSENSRSAGKRFISLRYAGSLNRHQLYIVSACAKDLFGWRIALVGRENQIEDVRFLFSPLTTPLWRIHSFARPASPPPFGERWEFLNSVRASNLA
jgi:hypothetical protein